MKHRHQFVVCMVSMLFLVLSAGCRKKAPAALSTPPAPAPLEQAPAKPVAPTISEFIAEPNRIERGQSSLLRWEVRDATEIQIDQGVGPVSASGKQSVSPAASTTYTLKATGVGGAATAAATLNVISPPPPPVQTQPPPARSFSDRLSTEVQDAYFDFDKYHIREDAMLALTKDAEALRVIFKDFPTATVVLEGHCDERGSAEYNLGLGDRRASSVKEFLVQSGISGNRLIPISYGKERPQCTEANEDCWQKNRRVHFAPGESLRTDTSQFEEPDGEFRPTVHVQADISPKK